MIKLNKLIIKSIFLRNKINTFNKKIRIAKFKFNIKMNGFNL